MSIFPFLIKLESIRNNDFFSAIVIITLLFSLNISSSNIFDEDYKDGSIDQFILAGIKGDIILISKIVSYWVINSVPTIIIIPIFGLLYSADTNYIIAIIIVSFFLTFILSILICFVSLLTIKIKENQLLKNLIIFPLSISTIIFANISITDISNGSLSDAVNHISIIIGIIMIILPIIIYLARIII
jgi:heme exporter protein B